MDRNGDPRSVGELVGDLLREIPTLFRKEAELFGRELRNKAVQAQMGIIWVGVGIALLVGAMMLLLAAAAIGVASLGIHIGWAALLVGVVVAIVAAVFVRKGLANMSPSNLTPTRTSRQLHKDLTLAKEQLK